MALNILGISAFGYNPGAALLRDGDLVAFAEEERFTRIKASHGAFPIRSIEYCLRAEQIDLDGVDVIAMGWDCEKYRAHMAAFFAEGAKRFGDKGDATRAWERNCLSVYDPDRVRARIAEAFAARGFRQKLPELRFVDHHLSHAASAFFPSGFGQAAVLTIDGSGEDRTTCIYRGAGADLTLLDHYQIPDSLGWFYSSITQFCGFQHNMDEGKLMGLAPYGKPDARLSDVMDRIVRLDAGRYAIDPMYTYYGPHFAGRGFARKLADALGEPHERGRGEHGAFYRDVAWAAQDKLEQVGLELTRQAMQKAGSRNLCLAGGVALNCKMNGAINQRAGVDEFFVQPVSSDAGTAIGAALWTHREQTGARPAFVQQHLYYGPEFTDDQIERALRACKLPVNRRPDIARDVADRIAAGKLCCWFQGRMEAGPRALGHRSILANPADPEMKAKLNAEVKHREMWRPFCPSLLAERRGDWLIDSDDAPYMVVAQQARPDQAHRIPSVVHVDGSVRPQMVHAHLEPLFHRLIANVEALTGAPMVVNTSFNVMGEPIICTPQEAVRCFYSTGLDVLGIGSFLLEKP
ncbi:MAG: carbamoyltransferase [Phycisphaerae bacterium]